MKNLTLAANEMFFSKHLSYQILFAFVLMVLMGLHK